MYGGGGEGEHHPREAGCSHTASNLCTLAEDGITHVKVVKHDFPDDFIPLQLH